MIQQGDSDGGVEGPTSELLPVRMLNEFTYCPRLFYLMHVEGRWADNVYTVEGKAVHRRIDQLDHVLPDAAGDTQSSTINGPSSNSDGRSTAGDDHAASGFTTDNSKPKTENASPDDGDDPPVISRSVPLGSERLGLTAKLDLVSTAARPDGEPEALPVETKRGRVPDTPERCYEPERVQLMAQGLLLREHGYACDHGVLYFAGSRTRVDVPFTPELEARTLDLIEQARLAAAARELPPPLDDSPKCCGCSLAGICLPDETLALRYARADFPDAETPGVPAGASRSSVQAAPADSAPAPSSASPVVQDARSSSDRSDKAAAAIRRLYPARDDALPLYVQEQGARVGKSGETLIVRLKDQELSRVRLKDTSQLVLCGNVSISAQTIHLLCEAGVPIVHLTLGHWFHGITSGITLRNAFDRAAQFAAATRPEMCLALAKDLVTAKGANQRTMLRRNGQPPPAVLTDMNDLLNRVPAAESPGQLLGLEGNLAAHYFKHFNTMLRPRDFDAEWDFNSRNRRPPRDPVNAMLSFGYALLAKEATVALLGEGLDPWWGLYHQPRHGRPALALDLMEPFRPLIVDSAVVTAINTGMVQARDFTRSASACILAAGGRKALIRAYEARLDQLITHPLFDYRCSWRAVMRVQARLLARWLRGDIATYESLVTR